MRRQLYEHTWILEDGARLLRICSFNFQFATYERTKSDSFRLRRERIREAASKTIPKNFRRPSWWALRINVEMPRNSPFYHFTLLHCIVGALCKRWMKSDRSRWERLGLYDDDSTDIVRVIHLKRRFGQRGRIRVEVFGCYPSSRSSRR